MEFDENARLDTSQIDDERGGRGGVFSSVPGGGFGVGGGAGLILLLVAALLGFNPLDSGGGATNVTPTVKDPNTLSAECRTGADANAREDCRVVAVVNSVQKFWTDELPRRGVAYQPAQTRLFSGRIDTGCGPATSDVGPFYCPGDRFVRSLSDQDIADGLDAAAAVGDDRIQREVQGRVDPESWTHGSSEQRQRWFSVGYRQGDPGSSDTFAAASL